IDLVAQEQILANTSLGVEDKISQLNTLASTYYGTAAAAEFMNMVQTSADTRKLRTRPKHFQLLRFMEKGGTDIQAELLPFCKTALFYPAPCRNARFGSVSGT
ncbi:MAG: hypothetical protein K2G87_01745, partial [Oscillospiraceae bacterium]|nr:hypothetical protein [Oscillospiraceae bacterium]